MRTSSLTLPPGPRSPAAWQLVRYSFSPLPFLDACRQRYGDAFTIRLAGYGSLVMLANPDAVRDVFRGDSHILHSGEGNEFLSGTVGDTSVLVLDDEPHERQRRVLLPPLKGERMRSFFDAMQAATQEAVRAFPVDRPFRMDEPMRQITLRVILQAVLGLQPGLQLRDLEDKVHNVLKYGRNPFGLIVVKLLPRRVLTNPRFLAYYRQLRALDAALFGIIEARRREPVERRGDSVLADLLAATHDDGQPLADVEIRDAVVTLLMAGHETTSLALAWALEQIVPRDDVVGQIIEELGGAPPRAEHLPRLDTLDAAIRESMRIRTILPFVVRLTKQPFRAGGSDYPPGILLCPCSHLVHRREDLYPEPDKFRPERFLKRKYGGNEWFPFGGGNRTCLGMAFALYEMKVVLGTLLAEVHLTRPPGSVSKPVRRGVTLAPSDGVMMLVKRRP